MKRNRPTFKLISFVVFLLVQQSSVYADRVKDIADVAGVRSNHLVGYGLVVGHKQMVDFLLPVKV